MKVIILCALIAVAIAQRPGFDHNDPLHHLIQNEVSAILAMHPGMSVDDCTAGCDGLFDMSSGHDESITDHICHSECQHQVQNQN